MRAQDPIYPPGQWNHGPIDVSARRIGLAVHARGFISCCKLFVR